MSATAQGYGAEGGEEAAADVEVRRERLNDISRRIIGCAYAVANELGYGFLERVYENALAYELREAGLKADQQAPVRVCYHGVIVGDYSTDLLVEDEVIIELKATKAIDDAHLAQCLNYLKATGLRLCLLINFGTPKLDIKRIVRDF